MDAITNKRFNMNKKKYDKEYVKHINEWLNEVMYQDPCDQDWTQFSLSIHDAMLAAATIFGSSTDEQKHNLFNLLRELTFGYALLNINDWDITYKKRENTNQ